MERISESLAGRAVYVDAPEMGGGGRQALDIVRAYWQRSDADP